MKNLLLIIVFAFFNFSSLQSQTPLESSDVMGQIGESFTIKNRYWTDAGDVELSQFNVESAGLNQVWDLTFLDYEDSHEIEYVNLPSSAFDSLFVNSSFAVASNSYPDYKYYTLENNQLSWDGQSNGGSSWFSQSDNELELIFPMTYGDTLTDYFQGQFDPYYLNIGDGPMEVTDVIWGTVFYKVDGHGTLLLPYGTIEDVYRVKHIEQYWITDYDVMNFYYVTHYSFYKAGTHNKIAYYHYYFYPVPNFTDQRMEYLEEGYVNSLAYDSDVDGDGIVDQLDNCSVNANEDQADFDDDGIGDACDMDIDNDGIPNEEDNCPYFSSLIMDDLDSDGIGDVCDDDIDGDGIVNQLDNCSVNANEDQADFDDDGIGDACDMDIDNDGIPNEEDNCPYFSSLIMDDLDSDGIGDVCDDDIDGDGELNDVDCSPLDSQVFIGAICDDGNEDTLGDYIQEDCSCMGVVVGIDNFVMEPHQVKLWPNPARDELNISLITSNKEMVKLELITAQGKIIEYFNSDRIQRKEHGVLLNISGVDSGVYFLRIITADNQYNRSFVVVK